MRDFDYDAAYIDLEAVGCDDPGEVYIYQQKEDLEQFLGMFCLDVDKYTF